MWTRWDSEILQAFEEHFPEITGDEERLRVIDEDAMKSPDGKARWRAFMTPFEKLGRSILGVWWRLAHPLSPTPLAVDDYNFGTLVRKDCEGDYSEENSIFGELSSAHWEREEPS